MLEIPLHIGATDFIFDLLLSRFIEWVRIELLLLSSLGYNLLRKLIHVRRVAVLAFVGSSELVGLVAATVRDRRHYR